MAKLNVVIPAVEVTVDGVTYRKVDRKAQAGDIVKALTDVDDITNGEFYAVYTDEYGEPSFNDDVDDARPRQLDDYAERYEVYSPISEPAAETITFEGATWRKVDRDVREGDAIKFTDESLPSYLTGAELYVVDSLDSWDDPQITDDDGDSYDAGSRDYEVYEKVADSGAAGASERNYREVKRWARKGERIRIAERDSSEVRYKNGDEFEVNSTDGDGDVRITVGDDYRVCVLLSEYVVLEPVTKDAESTQPERLKVGEYARYVLDGVTVMRTGDIVEILAVDTGNVPYYTKRLSDGKEAWTQAKRLVRATDEEVAAAKRAALIAKFSVGDSVKLTAEDGKRPCFGYGGASNGDIGKVTRTRERMIIVDFPSHASFKADASELTKLTAEEVVEIERKQAEEKRWAVIGRKVNEYKRGDIVECTQVSGNLDVGDIGEVDDLNVSASFRVNTRECRLVNWTDASRVKLIVPVEQRFDRLGDDVTEEVDAA